MKALARDGTSEGTWLRAERQSSGKGRMGRAWEGEGGNLFASTLVRFSSRDPSPASLAFVAAVTVHQVLSDFVGETAVRLKWPNDVMAGQAKLCGMLLERVDDAVIVGIGINVASAPDVPDRLTISLAEMGVSGCDAGSLTSLIAEAFAQWVERWRTYGTEPVIRAWMDRAHPVGTPLIAQLPDGERVEGRFETLDTDGTLILRLADGGRRAIHAGDVFLL